MADMFDAGYHFRSAWARGEANTVRLFGPFDPCMSAREAWILDESEGNLEASAFAPYERGWNKHAAEMGHTLRVASAT